MTEWAVQGEGARILVVDDEEAIIDLLETALRFVGFEVSAATTGVDALNAARTAQPDLVVLDVNLPDLDGFEVCRRLRRSGNDVPVIFLTARDDAADVRAGFTKGGDDYVKKPFSLEELTFRIAAVLRRRGYPMDEQPERLRCGDLVLDEDAHRVWRGEDEVQLTPTEFRLLRYLMLNRGRVVSKGQILDHVWNYDFDGDGRVVETYVSYLRKKIEAGSDPLILTVRGFGYSLRTDQE